MPNNNNLGFVIDLDDVINVAYDKPKFALNFIIIHVIRCMTWTASFCMKRLGAMSRSPHFVG
jgi:hypothetical protein